MGLRWIALLLLTAGVAHSDRAVAQPRLLRVRNLADTHEVLSRIHKTLANRGYSERRVLLREVDLSRAEIALRTGTDRDGHSRSWTWTGFDSNDATRARRGITPDKLTYAIDMTLARRGHAPDKNVYAGVMPERDVEGAPAYMRIGQRPGTAILVYARSGLERAQIDDRDRAARSEFWFKQAPKDALLYVVVPAKQRQLSTSPSATAARR